MSAPTSGIVVAGGKSTRLGRDKRQLRLGSPRTLLEETVSRVGTVADDVVVVVATASSELAGLTARVVQDPCPGAGPLNALVAGLSAIKHEFALVVACDLPFLNVALLRVLLEQPRDYDVLLPRRADGQLETLHAVYRETCLAPARRRLASGRLKLVGLVEDVRVRFVDEPALAAVDPDLLSFFNLNTAEDLKAVEYLLGCQRGTGCATNSLADERSNPGASTTESSKSNI